MANLAESLASTENSCLGVHDVPANSSLSIEGLRENRFQHFIGQLKNTELSIFEPLFFEAFKSLSQLEASELSDFILRYHFEILVHETIQTVFHQGGLGLQAGQKPISGDLSTFVRSSLALVWMDFLNVFQVPFGGHSLQQERAEIAANQEREVLVGSRAKEILDAENSEALMKILFKNSVEEQRVNKLALRSLLHKDLSKKKFWKFNDNLVGPLDTYLNPESHFIKEENLTDHPFFTEDTLGDLILVAATKGDEDLGLRLSQYFFSQPFSVPMVDALEALVDNSDQDVLKRLASQVFSRPHTKTMSHIIRKVILRADNQVLAELAVFTFPHKHTAGMVAELELLYDRGDFKVLDRLLSNTFREAHSIHFKSVLRELILDANQELLRQVVDDVFTRPHSVGFQDLVEMVIDLGGWRVQHSLADAFSKPHARAWEHQLTNLIQKANGSVDDSVLERISDIFSEIHTSDWFVAFAELLRKPISESILEELNSKALILKKSQKKSKLLKKAIGISDLKQRVLFLDQNNL